MLSTKKSIKKIEFLEVRHYGGWKIGERNEVEFTRVLLTLALRATAEDRN